MKNKKDIAQRLDIELLINHFYTRVKSDPIIGHFFTEVVQLSWEKHIPIMIDFWESLLFDKVIYKGNPIEKHLELNKKSPMSEVHFKQWMSLFSASLDELFEGEKVELAKTKVQQIGQLMQFKIDQSNQANFIQ